MKKSTEELLVYPIASIITGIGTGIGTGVLVMLFGFLLSLPIDKITFEGYLKTAITTSIIVAVIVAVGALIFLVAMKKSFEVQKPFLGMLGMKKKK